MVHHVTGELFPDRHDAKQFLIAGWEEGNPSLDLSFSTFNSCVFCLLRVCKRHMWMGCRMRYQWNAFQYVARNWISFSVCRAHQWRPHWDLLRTQETLWRPVFKNVCILWLKLYECNVIFYCHLRPDTCTEQTFCTAGCSYAQHSREHSSNLSGGTSSSLTPETL